MVHCLQLNATKPSCKVILHSKCEDRSNQVVDLWVQAMSKHISVNLFYFL